MTKSELYAASLVWLMRVFMLGQQLLYDFMQVLAIDQSRLLGKLHAN